MTHAAFERSRGYVYATRTRASDVAPIDTEARRRRDHHPNGWFRPGNQAAKNARGKQSVTRTPRQARNRLREALAEGLAPSEADRLLSAALARYEAARRDLGAESVLVLSPLARWAVDEELVAFAQGKAAVLGFDTPEGKGWLDRAHQAAARAERAMTGAMAAAGVVGVRKAKKPGASGRDKIKARAAELSKERTP
jgi:hypothetical protein